MSGEQRVSAHRRRTRTEVQELVAEFITSGMRRSEFCRSRALILIAGLPYVIVVVFGAFAELGVCARLLVPGNPAITTQNIMAHQTLHRLGPPQRFSISRGMRRW